MSGTTSKPSHHILIVDDDDDICTMIADFLTARGMKCTTADDARTAVDLIRRIPFDVVITDLTMPHVDGSKIVKLCDQMRLPCIAFSGSSERLDEAFPPDTIVMDKVGAMEKLESAITLQLHRREHFWKT